MKKFEEGQQIQDIDGTDFILTSREASILNSAFKIELMEGTDELSFLEWLYEVVGDEDEDYMDVISRRIDRIKEDSHNVEEKSNG